jgi:hypothetical protein
MTCIYDQHLHVFSLKSTLHPNIRVEYVWCLCERKEKIQIENIEKMGINSKTQNVAKRLNVIQNTWKPRARNFRMT